MYVKKADELTKAVAAANSARDEAAKATVDMQKERDVLKTLIGLPERTTDEIKTQFATDMAAYRTETKSGDPNGQPLFDPSTLYYHNLLASMNQVIQDRSNEVIRLSTSLANLETQFKNVSAMNNAALATVNADHAKRAADIQTTLTTFKSGLDRTFKESTDLTTRLKTIQTGVIQKEQKADKAVSDAATRVQKAQKEAADCARKAEQAGPAADGRALG